MYLSILCSVRHHVRFWLLCCLLAGFSPGFGQKLTATVTPIAPDCYVHRSFGRWQGQLITANGLIVNTTAGAVLIDTGWDVPQTRQLVRWVRRHLHRPVVLCVVTHSHADRVAGVPYLKKRGIRVASTPLTAANVRADGQPAPDGSLPNDTTFSIGGRPLRVFFPGGGHTADNIVVWLPTQKVLFGGCFIKSVGAMGLGNIADAVLTDWAQSIRRVADTFPDAAIVVPGHDEWGDRSSLTHTLKLLEMRPK
jgi:metallo-beta-lactamase class B